MLRAVIVDCGCGTDTCGDAHICFLILNFLRFLNCEFVKKHLFKKIFMVVF